jgi:predicted PurR-regulated permease PerM
MKEFPSNPTARAPSPSEIASWCLAAAALLLALLLHLLPALLAGLLVYELVHVLAPLLQRHLFDRRSRLVAVVVLSVLVVALLTAAIFGMVAFFRSDAGSLPALIQKMADIIEGTRNALPAWLVESLPTTGDAMRERLVHWLREHAPELQLAGREVGRGLVHVLVGMIIGAMVSLHEAAPAHASKPLARALIERMDRLGDAFRRIVFAQVRISGLNTIFTSIYLAAVLPLFGIQLPFTKTLIAITFLAGLLPVVGNLISNTVIVIVSLSQSPQVAIGSLVFLIAIHKLEYFLNARIIGSRIRARAWELLVAMLAMEAAFGLPGVVAAPIYYAYLKQELGERGLV